MTKEEIIRAIRKELVKLLFQYGGSYHGAAILGEILEVLKKHEETK